MSPGRRLVPTLRAIAGVIALYGLLLQIFVAALAPQAALAGPGLICLDGQASPQPDDGRVPDRPHGHECCTPSQAPKLAPPPAVVTGAEWSPDLPAVLTWRLAALAPKTGPPTRSQSARGPPTA